MPKKVEKTRAAGTKTEKGLMTHIVGILRMGTKRWAPKWIVMNEGRKRIMNPKTGKLKFANTCHGCKKWVFTDELAIDHIEPIGQYLDRTDMSTFEKTLGKYALAMYCETDNFQRLCPTCHSKKTKEERNK